MFDNTYVLPPYQHDPPSVHETRIITENRAPTDESIKLFRDMEQKAQDAVIGRLDIKNPMKGTILRRMSHSMFEHEIVLAFELNGEKYQTTPVKVPESYVLNKEEWIRKLFENMSQAIAEQLFQKNYKDVILGKL